MYAYYMSGTGKRKRGLFMPGGSHLGDDLLLCLCCTPKTARGLPLMTSANYFFPYRLPPVRRFTQPLLLWLLTMSAFEGTPPQCGRHKWKPPNRTRLHGTLAFSPKSYIFRMKKFGHSPVPGISLFARLARSRDNVKKTLATTIQL